jgi:hypothetical protein
MDKLAKTMPFSPHSILQVNVRLFGPEVNEILENLGGSEYDNLNFRSAASSLAELLLRFFATSEL